MSVPVPPEQDPLLAYRQQRDDPLLAYRAQRDQHRPIDDAPANGASGNIDLGKPDAHVIAGPITPVGVHVDDIARATSEGPLASRIAANIQVARDPALQRAVRPMARKLQAPSAAATTADIALSNLMAPFSERLASAGTEGALERYAEGGHDPSEHANLFGAAAAMGAIGGNAAIAGAGRAVSRLGSAASEVAPGATTTVGRIFRSAATGAKTNAAFGAGTTAAFGDEQGHRDLPAIAKAALKQGAFGAATGGVLGGASEGIGALAARQMAKRVADVAAREVPVIDDPVAGARSPAPVSAASVRPVDIPVHTAPVETTPGRGIPHAGLTYRDVLGMSADDIRSAYAGQHAYEKGAEEAVFGAEGAKRYRRLQAKSNSSFDMRGADLASNEIAQMESGLTPAQQSRLFGIGETGYNASELRSIAEDAHFYRAEQAHDIPHEMLLSTVGREMTTGKPLEDAGSAIRLRDAMAELQRRGVTPEDALREGLKARVLAGYATPDQAMELARATWGDLTEASARRGALSGPSVHGQVLAGRLQAPKASEGAASTASDAAPSAVENADDALEHRFSVFGVVPKVGQAIKTAYRGAMVTPYAKIESDAPDLVDALHTAGAARQAAQHVADRRVGWVTEGLTDQQRNLFGKQLVYDNLMAEATRKAASDPAAAANFARHAEQLGAQLPPDIATQPWFQSALDRHRQYVEPTMTHAAIAAGVDPASFRAPSSAYVRLVSEDRLTNQEIRRAMDATQVSDPGALQPRGNVLRALIGEKPELQRLFPNGTPGLRQGPLNPRVPSTGTDAPRFRQGATQTGSAQGAQGTAREYVMDYSRLMRQDAFDKVQRAGQNAVYEEVSKVGRALGPTDDPALGKVAVQRTVLDPTGSPAVERFEVDPPIAQALKHFEQQSKIQKTPGAWRTFTSLATRAQVAGMPVEATSHMNTLASIVASVPGEKDVAGKAMAALPGVGAKGAAIREMAQLDFSAPETRALESRLADIGALRMDDERGGLLNQSHRALFSPQGVDVRGRLVLARKYLARNPEATDRELREFVTGKLGNYVRANSGDAVNALQDSGLSAFARFQAARIPTSITSTFGQSGLPTSSGLQKAGDVVNTLYRGPLGYLLAGETANRLMTGHSMADNERAHQLDVQLPGAIGPQQRPAYLPLGFVNPLVSAGMRATGARDVLPLPGHANPGGMLSDVLRDVENTGLGVLSPAVRALSIAATGRTPYVTNDGSFLRVADNKFDKAAQARDRIRAALSLANPALSAFAEHGGDVGGRSLADALTEDGRPLGGPKAATARAAEFIFPRMLSTGVAGGGDAEATVLHRSEREYTDAINDYKRRLRGAPGPQAQDAIIAEAVHDATRDHRFDPDAVQQELTRYLHDMDTGKSDRTRERRDRSFERRKTL